MCTLMLCRFQIRKKKNEKILKRYDKNVYNVMICLLMICLLIINYEI